MSGLILDANEVLEFLRNTIIELIDVDEADLVPEMLLEDLNLTSLDFVEISVVTKKKYGVELTFELFTSGAVKTLGMLVEHIQGQK